MGCDSEKLSITTTSLLIALVLLLSIFLESCVVYASVDEHPSSLEDITIGGALEGPSGDMETIFKTKGRRLQTVTIIGDWACSDGWYTPGFSMNAGVKNGVRILI